MLFTSDGPKLQKFTNDSIDLGISSKTVVVGSSLIVFDLSDKRRITRYDHPLNPLQTVKSELPLPPNFDKKTYNFGGHAISAAGNHQVVMTGGGHNIQASRTALILDLVSRSWQELPKLKHERAHHVTCATENWVINYGGSGSADKLCLKSWRENRHNGVAVEWEQFHIQGIERISYTTLIAVAPQKIFILFA